MTSYENSQHKYYNRFRTFALFKIFCLVFAGTFAIAFIAIAIVAITCFGSDLSPAFWGWTCFGCTMLSIIVGISIMGYNAKQVPPKMETKSPKIVLQEEPQTCYNEMLKIIKSDAYFEINYEGCVKYWEIDNKVTKYLPDENELRGTIFYKYYNIFYHSREGIFMLYMLAMYRANLPSPFSRSLMAEYDCMDQKSEKVLTDYPWLIGIPFTDGSFVKTPWSEQKKYEEIIRKRASIANNRKYSGDPGEITLGR